MMLNRLLLICVLLPLAAIAQKREPKVILPVIQGKIVYDSTYTIIGKATEAEVLNKATKCLKPICKKDVSQPTNRSPEERGL